MRNFQDSLQEMGYPRTRHKTNCFYLVRGLYGYNIDQLLTKQFYKPLDLSPNRVIYSEAKQRAAWKRESKKKQSKTKHHARNRRPKH